ncbi:MAG TPA: RNA polymerase sigma factor [Trebonia sp.]|jgi:RNA polymerase sigma-70 factor (ECF subfamily)
MARSTAERPHVTHLAPGRLDRAVADARKGDATAFRLLYREFAPLLHRYLTFLAGDQADDIAARVWQRAIAELPGHRGNYQAFAGWLAGIARELAGGRPARDSAPSPSAEAPAEGTAAGGPTAGPGDDTDAALRLIRELPPDAAETVLLGSVVGLDARRTATVMGLRQGKVRAAARRGLIALADRL